MLLNGTERIETPRFILRKINIDDALDMYTNWSSDDDVTKYLNWHTHKNLEVSKEIIRSWMEQYHSPTFFQWAMEYKDLNQVIGTISLFNIDLGVKSAEVGYCMGRSFWNQGLMSEALLYVLKYAFETADFNIIFARHHVDNPASGKVMLKNHMKFIETKSEYSKKENKTIYLNHYAIKKEDFYETSIMER